MVGREAYHHPWWLARWDARFFGEPRRRRSTRRGRGRDGGVHVREQRDRDEPWPRIARHMLGLRNGLPGARRWRQVWSDHRLKDRSAREVQQLAAAALNQALAETSTT